VPGIIDEFSCEHCGRPETRQAARACDFCHDAMCFDCTEEHDAHGGECPIVIAANRHFNVGCRGEPHHARRALSEEAP